MLFPVFMLMKDGAELVCLIKPQFEAGREKVGKKGVVREPRIHAGVIEKVADFAAGLGFELLHLTFSPVREPEGNIEYRLNSGYWSVPLKPPAHPAAALRLTGSSQRQLQKPLPHRFAACNR